MYKFLLTLRPKSLIIVKMGDSTTYYREHPEARKKKAETDKKINARPEQVKKRVEANKFRKEQKAKGVDVRGKDAAHTKRGMVMKKTSVNRGSTGDMPGDRKARGGKKK